MRRYKVNGENGLVRDSASRALLYTNRQDAEAYRRRKAEQDHQNAEINTLKQEIQQLKQMIEKIIERQEKQ
jgi:uncharacterized protein YdcH (DUF465 family)